uniref:AMIN domain-containing protein n=1 Tax=Desertifilum tharense IPPAS B-1220 TaxID=1781255 RepID=A0ACD5GUM1_9CYAN
MGGPTQITGVRINPTSTGIDLILETQAGDRPQVFAVPRGNSWVADVINAQLRVPEGTTFTRTNPAPGIASISIAPLDTNSVRVTITATDQAISGEVIRREATGIAFSISTGASAAVPPQIAPAPQPPVTQAPAVPLPGIQNGYQFYPLALKSYRPFYRERSRHPLGILPYPILTPHQEPLTSALPNWFLVSSCAMPPSAMSLPC